MESIKFALFLMTYTPPHSNPKYEVWSKVNLLTESVFCATFGVKYSGGAVYLLIGADHRVPCGFHFIEYWLYTLNRILSFLQHALKSCRDPIRNLTDAVTDGTAGVRLIVAVYPGWQGQCWSDYKRGGGEGWEGGKREHECHWCHCKCPTTWSRRNEEGGRWLLIAGRREWWLEEQTISLRRSWLKHYRGKLQPQARRPPWA